MVFTPLLMSSCLRPGSLLLFQCRRVFADILGSPTIGKVSPTIGKIDRRRIALLINKIAIVSDDGRRGFADWFCLSAIGVVSPQMFLSLC
jgi:hypothetical protein